MEDDRRVYEDPRLVEVEDDGVWWAGTLAEWARWDDRGWMGLCTWTTTPGMRYMRWVSAGRVRER